MSAPMPEPSALVRTLEENRGQVLAQLSAALENPDIKALEWSKNGQSVLVHAELYEEEMGKNKELFPELADLGCVEALKAWLLACGFKRKRTKAKSQPLVLQRPDFQRAHPTAEEPGASNDAGLSAKQQKTKKRKRPPQGSMSQRMQGEPRRVRPLYQYINLDTPELMHPSSDEDEVPGPAQPSQVPTPPLKAIAPQLEVHRRRLILLQPYINLDTPEQMQSSDEDEVPGPAQPSQVPTAPGKAIAPQLEGTLASSTPEIPAPGAGDGYMMVDIDSMLRQAAQQVPELFPQFK
ncbi:uncharacterized protein C16orf86 homolog [Nyctibius grandis]|uniref:uncharacterized protein C16orf86 homolog n=1 Tax=Nyctibius grandis TaxID=48427 RepID=UPI0035BBEF3F